ncbi:MAG TPA: 3-deoxy-7-phosphoheptulonate synthase [Spirochaetia bacterium]|nr:3-deoxy-7-phosphoheptulonate synthase [Spirochaetia bacterium]
MVIVLRKDCREQDKRAIRSFLEGKGFKIREIVGEEETILGAVGLVRIDLREVELLAGVERVIPITKPYKLASREFKKDDTIVSVGSVRIGGPRITVIAGPCSVESREQVLETARLVRESGAVMLRGGAYKPRTSPYDFQGLGEEGLRYLKEAGEREGMPVISEIVSPELADMMKDYVDVFQVGARNMQNFELLKRIGAMGKPVVLKRGLAARVEDLLMAAEYLLAHGSENVVLCERGIRTFETYTRNTLDISAIPVVKKLSHLPILVDPSHATGMREKVAPMALASIAAGADGLLVEVHPDPEHAISDGPQSLFPDQFERLMRDIEALSPVVGKELQHLPKRHKEADRLKGTIEVRSRAGLRVAFQGERGAFSEKAILHYFEHAEVEPVARPSFYELFKSVLDGDTDYGMVPVENSLAGSIHENYDLLLQFPDIKIVGEKKIRVVHNLIGVPGAKIEQLRRVYSHPQGLAQCASFLDKLPAIERIPFYDTAGSVAFIAREGKPEQAAIASSEAAQVYGMEILKEAIETNSRNYTRFVVITRREHEEIEEPNLASLVFSTPDKPGALFTCLQILAERSMNLKKLESRPILGRPWQYMFYLDVELPPDITAFDAAVELLRSESEDLRVLGLYRASP